MEGASVGMTVAGVLENVSTVINTVVTCVTGNPVIAVFVGMGVVGGGIALFRKLMRAGK